MRDAALEPCWVLHRRPFKDSAALIDMLTLHSGVVRCVAKGLHRRAYSGPLGSILQSYTPLLARFVGRSDLRTLAQVELAGPGHRFLPPASFSAMYLNELLLKIGHAQEPMPQAFAAYGRALSRIEEGAAVLGLREFEHALLAELGYAPHYDHDLSGQPIVAEQYYRLLDAQGYRVASGEAENAIRGADLLAIARRGSDCFTHPTLERVVRSHQRALLEQLLDGRSLKSRELAHAFEKSLTQSRPETQPDAGDES